MSANFSNYRIERFENEEVYILDNIFPEEKIESFHKTIALSSFSALHSKRDWMVDYEISDFKNHSLYDIANKLALSFCDSAVELTCYSIFCNAMSYGNQSLIHNDSDKENVISILYYVNSKWDYTWEGETIFFDNFLEPRIAINPKPGRFLAFTGKTLHRAGIPSRICPEIRLTLSFRFQYI